MSLTVYGSSKSRTMRVLWMATELNLEFEHIPVEYSDSALKKPEFLSLNPAGAIPTIVDDGFALGESLAINLYLAKKYGERVSEKLYPCSLKEEADIWRWSLWAQGHLEPWIQKDKLLANLIKAIAVHTSTMVDRSLSTLNRALKNDDWLLGQDFTVADLNVAAILSPSRAKHLNIAEYEKVANWLSRCYQRPASIAVRKRFSQQLAQPC